MIDFAKARKGLPRLGARLRAGEEVRILAFGGGLTYDGYYLASAARMLRTSFPQAVIETATRALPGFTSDRAVFRAQSALDLNPDLSFVEFASEDVGAKPERIAFAAEGIVRRLRWNDPERDIAFLYFGAMRHAADGSASRAVAQWERVADYYGIPSFDCNVLAEWFVQKQIAIWLERWPGRRTWIERRPIALTRDGVLHTAGGGSLFGSHIAQAILTMTHPSTLMTQGELMAPLLRANWSDATMLGGLRLSGEGWVGGPLADELHSTGIAVCFDELSAAAHVGARLRVEFVGRFASLWIVGTGGTVAVAIDGSWSELKTTAGGNHYAHELLSESENRRHTIEIEARALPAVIAGLDLLGQVLPEPASNG